MVLALFLCAVPSMALCLSLLGFYKNAKNWRIYSVMYVSGISMLAYSFAVKGEMDLTRYHSWLKSYAGELPRVITNVKDGLYLQGLFFWFVQKTGDKNLLQTISIAVVYGTATYITCSTAEKFENRQGIFLNLVLQALFLPFVSLVSNIRNIAAFSLIVLAGYREMVQNKRGILTIVLYILPCYLHTAGVVLLLLRMFLGLAKEHRLVIMVSVFFLPIALEILYQYKDAFAFVPVLSKMISKAYNYLNGTDSIDNWAVQVAASPWQKVYKLIFLVYIALLALYIYRKTRSGVYDKAKANLCAYAFLLCLLTLSSTTFSTPQYWRFGAATTLVQGGVINMFEKSESKRIDSLIYWSIWISGIACTVLNLYRLPSQVYFMEWIKRFLLCNPYEIAFNAICNW